MDKWHWSLVVNARSAARGGVSGSGVGKSVDPGEGLAVDPGEGPAVVSGEGVVAGSMPAASKHEHSKNDIRKHTPPGEHTINNQYCEQ